VVAITQRATKLRSSLNESQTSPAVNGIKELEDSLTRISEILIPFEQRFSHLQALAGIGQIVNSTLELDEVLQVVMDTIVRLTEAERGFLMLRNAEGEMESRIARNWEQESINKNEFAISRTIVERVINGGEAVLTTNAREDPRFDGQESIIAFNLRSILCVPLMVKTDLIGVIYTDNRIRSGIFSEADRDLLISFANQAAVAIENARLFSSLKVTLEEVTGLKNLMDDVFASIVSGVITADVDDQITLCNRAAAAFLGQASSEIVGRKLEDIVPSFASDIRSHLNSVRESEQPIVGLELSPLFPERGHVDWQLNLSPLKDAGSKTQGVAIVLDDLTERKKLEGQRKLFERMVSPAVIQQLDPNSLQLGGKRVDLSIARARDLPRRALVRADLRAQLARGHFSARAGHGRLAPEHGPRVLVRSPGAVDRARAPARTSVADPPARNRRARARNRARARRARRAASKHGARPDDVGHGRDHRPDRRGLRVVDRRLRRIRARAGARLALAALDLHRRLFRRRSFRHARGGRVNHACGSLQRIHSAALRS
jgi:PAS domain S-box-containing protein